MAAASRAVSTSGRAASALVEPARSSDAVGEEGRTGGEWSPDSGVSGHCCSWARGTAAGGGRFALPSRAAGVGPYLDPTPRCGGFSLVGGLILLLLALGGSGRQRTAGGVVFVAELAEQA